MGYLNLYKSIYEFKGYLDIFFKGIWIFIGYLKV